MEFCLQFSLYIRYYCYFYLFLKKKTGDYQSLTHSPIMTYTLSYTLTNCINNITYLTRVSCKNSFIYNANTWYQTCTYN